MKTAVVMGAALLALWAGAASSAPAGGRGMDLPVDGVITNPDWARMPSGEDLWRHYPPLPLHLELPGRVVISCSVNAGGRLHNCIVAEETPVGLGFGRAAVNMAGLFQMKPLTVDGRAVDGGEVRVPLKFETYGADEPVARPARPAVDPVSLALARRVTKAIRAVDGASVGDSQKQALRKFWGLTESQDLTALTERRIAVDAIADSLASGFAAYDEEMAYAYAANFTPEELEQLAVFWEGPVGRLLARRQTQMTEAAFEANKVRDKVMAREAQRRLCQQITCVGSTASPAASRRND